MYSFIGVNPSDKDKPTDNVLGYKKLYPVSFQHNSVSFGPYLQTACVY